MFPKNENAKVIMSLRQSGIRNIDLLKAIELFPPSEFINDIKITNKKEQLIIKEVAIIAKLINLTMPIKRLRTNVLTIGCFAGWTNLVLSMLYRRVYTICLNNIIKIKIEKKTELLNLKNIFIKKSLYENGWPEVAPFETIISFSPFVKLPSKLLNQLSSDALLLMPLFNKRKKKYEVILINNNKKIFEANVFLSELENNNLI